MLYLRLKNENDYLIIDVPGFKPIKISTMTTFGVKLAIEEFEGVGIWRKEIWEKMEAEKKWNPGKPILRLNRDSIPVGAQ